MVIEYIEEDENGRTVTIFHLDYYRKTVFQKNNLRMHNMERIKETLDLVAIVELYRPQEMPSADYGRIPSEADY